MKKGTREDGGNLIKLFLYSAFWAAATEVVAGWQVATLATASHCQFIPRTHIFVRFQTWGIPTNRKLLLMVTTCKAKVVKLQNSASVSALPLRTSLRVAST